MANNSLNLVDRINEYIGIFEGRDEASLSVNENVMLTNIRKLYEIADKYLTPDENGDYKVMPAKDLNELKIVYSLSIESINRVITNQNTSKIQNRFKVVAEQMKNLLLQDADVIYGINAKSDIILPSVINVARMHSVKVRNTGLKSHGAANSERIPIKYLDENNVEHKGFFTKANSLTLDDQSFYIAQINDNIKLYPKYETVFKALSDKSLVGFVNIILREDDSREKFNEMFDYIGVPEKKRAELYADETFKMALCSMRRRVNKASQLKIKYGGIGAKNGSGIESRNNALYNVSKLFGVDNIIARSENMVVDIDGQKVAGSFMDTVIGSDYNNPKENDPMYKWSKNVGANAKIASTGRANKQLSQLNVLDYICANYDRHGGNIIYDFNNSDPENPVLCGIKGIDNDLSFGTNYDTNYGTFNIKIDTILFIDEVTARKIFETTQESLALTLMGSQLSKEEIDAAWERTKKVQDAIRKGLSTKYDKDNLYQHVEGAIRILTDEQFAQLEIGRVSEAASEAGGMTSFTQTFMNANGFSSTYEQFENKKEYGVDTIEYNEADLSRSVAGDIRVENLNKCRDFRSVLDKNDPFFHINTKEYKNMSKALDRLSDKLTLGVENMKAAEAELNALMQACSDYIGQKKALPKSDYGIARLEMARQMRDFAKHEIEKANDVTVDATASLNIFHQNMQSSAARTTSVLERAENDETNESYRSQVRLFMDSLSQELAMQIQLDKYNETQNPKVLSTEAVRTQAEILMGSEYFGTFARNLVKEKNISEYTSEEIMMKAKAAKQRFEEEQRIILEQHRQQTMSTQEEERIAEMNAFKQTQVSTSTNTQ